MKILFSADHHIKLGAKKVPSEWQVNRFELMVDKLNKIIEEHNIDLHILGGDLLDVPKPKIEEIELFFYVASALKGETWYFTGNHEMLSKKKSLLLHLQSMLEDVGVEHFKIVKSGNYDGFDILDYSDLHQKPWVEPKNNILFTHVRGEIPPHVKPEVDLDRFKDWEIVFAGDLHAHSNSQENIVYPGSPMTTSFHRNITKGENGCIIVDTEKGTWEFIDLELPQLIRKTVTTQEEMVGTDYHHTIYELDGTLEEIAKLDENNELLDKKVIKKPDNENRLDFTGNLLQDVSNYLYKVKQFNKTDVERLVNRLNEHTNY